MSAFEGKVALVTGAAKGMGAAEARLLASQGACVLVSDVDPDGEAVAEEIGKRAVFVRHDVSSEKDWARVVALAEERFGRLDYLVNNAGIFAGAMIADTALEVFERINRINQIGVFLGIRAVIDPMTRAGGGAIVNTSSVAAIRSGPGVIAYAASKWAVRGMTRCAAVELADKGIRVNAIFPGAVDTPMFQANPPEFSEAILQTIPMRRVGSPDEIAEAVAFLLSDKAGYITGGELSVDGGQAI